MSAPCRIWKLHTIGQQQWQWRCREHAGGVDYAGSAGSMPGALVELGAHVRADHEFLDVMTGRRIG